MDTALREHEGLVRQYFATIIPPNDNKLAALNSAVWSGGSFVYVPEGVHVDLPLQAYFRINTENMGQFERTLIIAEPGSYVHYVEGCTAPTYSSDSLHSAVVELIALPGARIRYTTVQNWSTNVYNLVTKRAVAYADATVEWVDCNLGSKLTMKYPSIYLLGERAHGEVLSIAFAGAGQHQDAGAKIIHAAPNTTSNIFAKSICKDGGRGSYRGLLEIAKGAHGSRSKVVCDALLLDEHSRSDTYPMARSSRSPSPAPASTRTRAPKSSTPRPTQPRTSSPSRSARTAAAGPTGACSRSPRAPTAPAPRSSATHCSSMSTRAPTPTPWRGPLDRLRRRRPAPGRGRQNHPRRAQHNLEHLRQVDLQGRRPRVLPGPARDRQGRPRLPLQGRLRRIAPR